MLASLAYMFLIGMMLGAVFQRMRLPSLIGMLLTGIILGPYVLNLLDESILSISADLREVALITILMRAGLSLDISDLKMIGRPAVLMSFFPAIFEMSGTVLVARLLFNLPLLDAGILAAVVASASPAVIVPRMIKLIETGYGTDKKIPQLVLASDSVDDMFNIVVFTSLLGLTNGEVVSAFKFSEIPISIATGVLVGIIVGWCLVLGFKNFHLRDSIKVIILLSVAFLLVTVEEVLVIPFSGLLTVMVIGIVLLAKLPNVANRISIKFSKVWVAAEVLLFVLVGASVNITYVSAESAKTLLLLVLVLLFRAVGILLSLIDTGLNWKERLFCIFAGIPKATVQAAIGGIPLAMGLPNGGIILAIAVISILFCAPVGALILDSTYKKLLNHTE
ncbi:cation:proton antiporter [Enterococcus sp. CWB-B31]|uniref:cation:proton antiporter domain-containing protein n=1 Tax=Enterococcus sp. CWB-B31 TaxID=2885159 RepID=UPI001E63F4BC|nr:cation:proton antiporter [Enterococcus sp. CWB-B31]MCB5955718.1 cation:proton antiporter [Enterococcus sp. CWB-B31]